MTVLKHSVGIDVSKDTLACCYGNIDHEQNESFSKSISFANSQTGFNAFYKWVNKKAIDQEVWYVMEATGVYYENLAYWLLDKGVNISVLLPSKSNHFAKTLEIKTKTDMVDAMILSKMGLQRKLRKWTVHSKLMHQIRALTREFRETKAKVVVSKNQLHAKKHAYNSPKSSLRRLIKQIQIFENHLLDIESELRILVLEDSVLYDKIEKLQSIPGVNFMTIICILGETNGFALIANNKQLVSYAGLDIRHKQSGKKEGKSKISKQGNSFIRNALYMPALCSSVHNPDLKKFYKRVIDGKPSKKIGVIAVARKLLILMYTLWKNDSEYIPNYYLSYNNK